ncbi:MAG: lamin tail domain-containing protein [Saprospiraceae bacterium]|nr:lamin tail domain-containing protein [Saprospiraceae bacterium]
MVHRTALRAALLPALFVFLLAPFALRGQDVILQGFYWNTHPGDVSNTTTGGIWWDTLNTVAPQLAAAGFQTVWTPPPTKSFAGVWDMGYGTYDYFDLGNILSKGTTRTRHGSRAELSTMITALHNNGLKVMADVVLNHRGGANAQAPYQIGGFGTGYNVFMPESQRIPSGPEDVHPTIQHPDLNPDYHNRIFFEDICHFNEHDAFPPTNADGSPGAWYYGAPTLLGSMGDSLIMWGRWLVNDIGYDELRLDAVKHIDPWFIKKFLIESKNGDQPFAIGESFEYGSANLVNYWTEVQKPENSGGVKNAKISLFDFPLRGALKSVLNTTDGSIDLYNTLGNAGLVWGTTMGGFDVVTWLESHDTDRQGYIGASAGCPIPYGASCLELHTENDHDPVTSDKEDMGYPFLLAAEGRPVVFWKDWYWYGLADDIQWQMALRQTTATGSSDHVQNMGGDWNVAGYTIDNHGGNMFALRRNGFTGGASDGMVLGLNDDDDREHAVYVNTPFSNKYLKDYSDSYLFQSTIAPGDTRTLIKAQKRDYSWWSVTGLYPKSAGTPASHFNMGATPGGCPHFIAICAADAANLIVNGAPIAVGAEVAVKNAAGQVVGIGRIGQGFRWDGTHDMIIEALGPLPVGPGISLAPGEAFRVFVYDASAATETEIGSVQYAAAASAFTFAPERPNSPNRNGSFATFPVTTTASGAFACQGISRILAFNTQVALSQAFCATDQADGSTYNSGWTNGLNGGSGFGAWQLSTSTPPDGSKAGFFIGSSASNGDGDSNGNDDINTGGEAFAMYANSGYSANAVRPFAAALPAGTVFSLKMDNGWIEAGGTVGLGLQNASGENLLEFYFRNGEPDYKTNDLTNEHPTSIGFTDEGLDLQFSLPTATSYQLVVTPLGGASATFTGSLKNPAGGQLISQVRLFNANAGAGGQRNAYFNNLSVCYPATLVINEVDYDQDGADSKEFVEIKNVSTAAVNLDPYKLELVNGSGGAVYTSVDLPNVSLAAGDYYVICGNGSGVSNCDLSFAGASDQIQNDAPDALRLVLNNQITVDALSYEGSTAGATEGSGTGLDDDGTATRPLGLSRSPDGNDTDNNNTDFILSCITPGVANVGNTNSDGDAIPNTCDNCPTTTNDNQLDTDIDGQGNACDACPLAVPGLEHFNSMSCNCEPGYYPATEVRNGQAVIVGCQPCPAGSYCPDGVNTILCPPGKYSNVEGAAECLNCAAGSYQGQSGQTSCVSCPPGKYSDVQGATECLNCAAGSYQGQSGQTSCVACPPGKYSDVQGATECVNCAAGTYQGLSGQTSCTACPPGKYSDVQGATECLNCAAGSYQGLSGQTSCVACPPGKYSDVQGATECVNCAAGTYQGLSGQTSCTACPPGQFSNVQGATECVNCTAGTYQGLSGQTSCTACPPGQFSNVQGATECVNCAAGTYQGLSGQTSCTACPPGKFSDVQGATECQNCAAGHYQDQSGQTSCIACQPGTFSSTEGSTVCLNCAVNTYNNTSGSTECQSCGAGFYSPEASTACSSCAVHFTATPTPVSCPGALDGQLVVSNVTGGTGPFLYSVNNGSSYSASPTFTGLAAGVYPVRVKDAYLCESAAQNITVGTGPCGITFAGTIRSSQNSALGVQNATVKLSGASTGTTTTNLNGEYTLSSTATGSFQIKPSKNINRLNGVTSADAMAIQQHVANATLITDPAKLIAADVNRSNSISTVDATLINQSLLNNGAANAIFSVFWRFVPSTHTLSVPPWGFPEQISLTGVSTNQTNKDFIGIKIGDVVSTYANPANLGSARPLVLRTPDQELHAGATLSVSLDAGALDALAAFQMGLRFDPDYLQLQALEPLSGLPLTAANLGLDGAAAGEIRVAWSQATGLSLAEGTPLTRLDFVALQGGGRLSEVLHLDDALLLNEAYTPSLEAAPVLLEYTQATGTGNSGAWAAQLSNRPNPFAGTTTLGFALPEGCAAQLRILDVNGREIARLDKQYPAAGRYEETLELTGVTGVLYAELLTPFGVWGRKMVALGQ